MGGDAFLPYLTCDLPGLGGAIKQRPEDFIVEELPLYEACGEGTHVYFTIEKAGLTTMAAAARVAGALGRAPREIGYAGMKDARALTRQTFSLEHVDPQRVQALDLPGLRVLGVTRHGNKLRIGHLRGNRFVIKFRGAAPGAAAIAAEVLAVLLRRGVPNYFGDQRFGYRRDNAAIGAAVLRGDFETALAAVAGTPGAEDRGAVSEARRLFDLGHYAKSARTWPGSFRDQIRICRALQAAPGNFERGWAAVDHRMRKLYLSAAQSALFNRVAAERIQTIDRLEVGDMAYKHDNGACFLVEDAAAEQPRCDQLEISPTGPIYGTRTTPAGGEPGRREADVLAAAGLRPEDFRAAERFKLKGARRPLRVPLTAGAVTSGEDDAGPYLELRCELPAGSYATCVTRELCKN